MSALVSLSAPPSIELARSSPYFEERDKSTSQANPKVSHSGLKQAVADQAELGESLNWATRTDSL
ncbi:hypothetical protein [Marinobacterium sp. BA1]|uniref:hypothetical protein n=1 Tax=Marinobacterium sp. BA1 TaxID=3138931 RepID=UPI0032E75596